MKREISQIDPDYLAKCLNYNHETGEFSWKHRDDMSPQWNGRFAGKPAFTTKNAVGYYVGSVCWVKLLAHRVAWALHYGSWPEDCIDHINGNTLDNRICNLRTASKSTNGMNRRRQENNKSGVKGVYFDTSKGKWVAQLTAGGKRLLMRRFNKLEDAKEAYAEFAKLYHGEYARID